MIVLSLAHSPAADAGPHEKVCTFCRRVLASIDLLVAAPEVSICSTCIDRCIGELRLRRVPGFRRWWDPRPWRRSATADAHGQPDGTYRAPKEVCGFCLVADAAELIAAEHARICSNCVRIAADVFAEHRRPRGR